ncbi:MAG TPA: HAMP domain-containing sensor histidine kinase [Rhizomicrobium sp.]|nr:HAMP domain-containing sensor histidine kinase [Rhizomicrobium sp.]
MPEPKKTTGRASLLSRYSEDLGVLISRRDSEDALHAAAMQEALANRAKSQFLANMSHELRTPLNAIIGFSSLLQGDERVRLAGQAHEYAGYIESAGHHLLSIISDILDISKIESETFELQLQEGVLCEVVEAAASLVRAKIAEKHQTFTIHMPDGVPSFKFDARRLKQVLTNLLSNAHKFTPERGTIRLIVAVEPEHVAFAVVDNGIGMTPDQQKIALQPFAQVESAYTRTQEGTGLGLPIAKALVEQHGGTFRICSEPEQGTQVVFTLPMRPIGEAG